VNSNNAKYRKFTSHWAKTALDMGVCASEAAAVAGLPRVVIFLHLDERFHPKNSKKKRAESSPGNCNFLFLR
jgi:hypothetical protein